MKRAAVACLIFVLFPFALTLHAQAQAPAHGGEVKTESPSTPISVPVMLSLHALDDAEALMKSLTTPGDPQFHKFLTDDSMFVRWSLPVFTGFHGSVKQPEPISSHFTITNVDNKAPCFSVGCPPKGRLNQNLNEAG